jgi:diguanylate cyclase (GGDEF)-like protein
MEVLVVEAAPGQGDQVRALLDDAAPGEFTVLTAASPEAAIERLLGIARPALGVVLLELPPGPDGLERLEHVRTAALGAALVVLAEQVDDALALEAVSAGAQEVLAHGEARGRVLARVLRHAAERQRRENDLAHRALHDPLTGLPNRTLFFDRLRQAIVRTRRAGSCLAVMFLDLDGFKAVNDARGHGAGDDLLVAAGQALTAALRGGDTAARVGGDEFVVLCEDVPDEAEVRAIAERLLAGLPLPASVGVVLVGEGDADPEHVVRDADAAMYAVKHRGGGGILVLRR